MVELYTIAQINAIGDAFHARAHGYANVDACPDIDSCPYCQPIPDILRDRLEALFAADHIADVHDSEQYRLDGCD